jgi:hypothetical protein
MEWKRFSQITGREALLYEAVERLASTALTHQSEIMNGDDGEVVGGEFPRAGAPRCFELLVLSWPMIPGETRDEAIDSTVSVLGRDVSRARLCRESGAEGWGDKRLPKRRPQSWAAGKAVWGDGMGWDVFGRKLRYGLEVTSGLL